MTQYLTLAEIQAKCERLMNEYEVDEDKFFQIVEGWSEANVSIEEKLIASFTGLLEAVSSEITSMEEHVALSVTCRLGCAFCCYFPIIVNEMEAKLIQKAIEAFPEDRRDQLEAHLTYYYEKNGEQLNSIEGLNFINDPEFKLRYRRLFLPCPLLNTETNQCMAYEIRPIPCRTYVNYTNPKICKDNLMPNETISFEFLYGEYMGALNEFLQFLYEEGDTGFIRYPDDLYREDYLVNWLKR